MKKVEAPNGDKTTERYRKLIQQIAEFAETDTVDSEPVLFTQHIDKVLNGLGIEDEKAGLIVKGFLKVRDKDPEIYEIILDPCPELAQDLEPIAQKIREKMENKLTENIYLGFVGHFTRELPQIISILSEDPLMMDKLIESGYVIVRSVMTNTGKPDSWYVCLTIEESKGLQEARTKQAEEN